MNRTRIREIRNKVLRSLCVIIDTTQSGVHSTRTASYFTREFSKIVGIEYDAITELIGTITHEDILDTLRSSLNQQESEILYIYLNITITDDLIHILNEYKGSTIVFFNLQNTLKVLKNLKVNWVSLFSEDTPETMIMNLILVLIKYSGYLNDINLRELYELLCYELLQPNDDEKPTPILISSNVDLLSSHLF
jgi:hypothetical protein